MNKNVKLAITQTKDYTCSSEYGKDFAKNVVVSGVGLILGRFILNVLDNITSED